MGNRAVIVAQDTTKENASQKVGVYLHWYGSRDSVESFLKTAKEKQIRGVMCDPQYAWARLCQIIGDALSEQGNHDCSLGVGIVSQLDCFNGDNGTYYIDDKFDIVKQTDGGELG